MKCMICKERGCDHENADLTQHVNHEHGVTTKEYKRKYGYDLVDMDTRKARSLTRNKNNYERRPIKCPVGCLKAFKTEKQLIRHCYKAKDKIVEHSHIIFNDSNIDNWVECRLCGFRRSKLDHHIKNEHVMSIDDYERRHGSAYSKNFITNTTESGSINHERENYIGSKNYFYGHKHTEDAKRRIVISLNEDNARRDQHFNVGRHPSEEARHNMSLHRMGPNNGMFGKKPADGTSRGIQGFRRDVGHHVRSTFEANYIRYLKFNNIKYEYEPIGLLLYYNDRQIHYWPDIKLEDGTIVELKNYERQGVDKFKLAVEQYPTMLFKIIYQHSDEWKATEKEYKVLIPLWETNKQNLRKTKGLYIYE